MTGTSGYAGDISPSEAMTMLQEHEDAVLVDVRSRAEWSFVGVPDLVAIGKEPVFVEWQSYPTMGLNSGFAAALRTELEDRGASKTAPILFLCRSGARSRAAALAITAEGYEQCFNVAGGFEGGPDPSRHRGTVDGWKASDLPWVQS